ncbi:hypothetical protein CLJ1_2015 [Pseudomonas paraeruginosa]|nr:hypothetical protein CLJ1_2015 [Pseudomonas aeruginosa]
MQVDFSFAKAVAPRRESLEAAREAPVSIIGKYIAFLSADVLPTAS